MPVRCRGDQEGDRLNQWPRPLRLRWAPEYDNAVLGYAGRLLAFGPVSRVAATVHGAAPPLNRIRASQGRRLARQLAGRPHQVKPADPPRGHGDRDDCHEQPGPGGNAAAARQRPAGLSRQPHLRDAAPLALAAAVLRTRSAMFSTRGPAISVIGTREPAAIAASAAPTSRAATGWAAQRGTMTYLPLARSGYWPANSWNCAARRMLTGTSDPASTCSWRTLPWW